MNKSQAKERIQKLKKLINHHSYRYHVLDKPEVSDAVWDSLKKELADLEKKFPEFVTLDSPTQRVSGKPLDKFEKVKHSSPILSLQDAFSFEEIKEWEVRFKKLLSIERGRGIDYFVEYKMDGLNASLVYKKGEFVRGATRGDGRTGENVTQNLRTVSSIPLRLQKSVDCEVRGEIFITKKDFKKFSKKYANPRNLAAGSVRQLNPRIASQRKLNFMAWQLVGEEKQNEEREELIKLGFKPAPGKFCKNLKKVKEYFQSIKRDKIDYEIDGVVVGVNDNKLKEELGVVGKSPRGAIAWKFPNKEATTLVKDIKIQVGRTGVLTPVAILEPVGIKGVTVSRATLHNKDEIKRLGLKIGDTVVVGRAGDVIPDVKKALKELRAGGEKNFKMPTKCPICGNKIEEDSGGILLRCVNKKCSSRLKRNISYFVSRPAFNIEGLGPQIIDVLLDQGLIQDSADLFELKEGDLEPLERFAEKSAKNLVKSIDSSRKISLPRFIISLGIMHVGEETAYDLANRFGSLEKIRKIDFEDLEKVSDIGPVIARSIYEWFRDGYNKDFLRRLLKHVSIKKSVRQAPSGKAGKQGKHKKLEGKMFVLTGSLSSMSRDSAKTKIREQGGDISGSVSKETDYVIVGEEPGSKLSRAQKLNIKILNEKEFNQKLKSTC